MFRATPVNGPFYRGVKNIDIRARPEPLQGGYFCSQVGSREVGNSLVISIASAIYSRKANACSIRKSSGADSSSRNAEGRTPLDEALLQSGQYAETYFPVQPNRTEEA